MDTAPASSSSPGRSLRWNRIIGALALLLVAVMAMAWIGWPWWNPHPPSTAPRMAQLSALGKTLKTYANQHGSWPYSDAGSDAAAYLLHEAVPAATFDVPHAPGSDGSAAYDHDHQQLVGSGYLYLNPPPKQLRPTSSKVLCLAVERQPDDSNGVYALFSDGSVLYVPLSGNMTPADLLGKDDSAARSFTGQRS